MLRGGWWNAVDIGCVHYSFQLCGWNRWHSVAPRGRRAWICETFSNCGPAVLEYRGIGETWSLNILLWIQTCFLESYRKSLRCVFICIVDFNIRFFSFSMRKRMHRHSVSIFSHFQYVCYYVNALLEIVEPTLMRRWFGDRLCAKLSQSSRKDNTLTHPPLFSVVFQFKVGTPAEGEVFQFRACRASPATHFWEISYDTNSFVLKPSRRVHIAFWISKCCVKFCSFPIISFVIFYFFLIHRESVLQMNGAKRQAARTSSQNWRSLGILEKMHTQINCVLRYQCKLSDLRMLEFCSPISFAKR